MQTRFRQLEQLEQRQLMAGLLHQGDLGYVGAFNVPQGTLGSSTFEYGGTALAYNPADNGLFMVGHDWDQQVAEISIPTLTTGTQDDLATADLVQPFTPVLSELPNQTLDATEGIKVGGLMVNGNQLIGTAYEFYDGLSNAVDSHFTLSSTDLSTAQVGGLYQVGNLGGGFVGGYMTAVPPEWQSALGTSYLTGQAALSIINRTSAGPAAFGFDPSQLGPETAPVTPLVYYPIDTPLAPVETQNSLFNTTTEIKGVVFPQGTDSVLFIGSQGTGPWWYGEYDQGGFDPYRQDKGPHAPDYVYQVWAYDAHDLAAVKNGEMQPWELQPYDVWNLNLPYADGSGHIGGVAYDAASGKIYISQEYGNQAYPVVYGFQVGVASSIPATPGVKFVQATPSLPENTPTTANVKVGQLSIAGISDAVTLSIVGADSDLFVLQGSSLYLKAGTQLDFEHQASYNITVQGSAASLGNTVLSASFSLGVSDVNEAPSAVLIAAAMNSIPENTAVANDLRVADLSVVDDALGTNVLSLSGADKTYFRLVGNSVYLKAGVSLDFEKHPTLSVTINATDASLGVPATIATYTLNLLDINEAPWMTVAGASPLLTMQEDDQHSPGTPIEALVAGISDQDANSLRGIAITGLSGLQHGQWTYSLDQGVTWQSIFSVSPTSALLLPADGKTLLRFVPFANYNGTVAITYQAWDRTEGTPGGAVNLSFLQSANLTSAFSKNARSSLLTITPVNDAPVLDNTVGRSLATINEDNRNSPGTTVVSLLAGVTDADVNAARGIAVTAAGTTHGVWQYSLNGGTTWRAMGIVSASAARMLPADGLQSRVRFLPNQDFNGTVNFAFVAWDQTQGVSGTTIDLSVASKIGGTTAFSLRQAIVPLIISPVNDASAISLPATTGFAIGGPAVSFANTASVTDVDTINYKGGWLKVRITGSPDAGDRLTIGGMFTIVAGNVLWNNSVSIGTVNASVGIGGNPVTIVFNENATKYRVTQLVRSMRFATLNSSTATGARTVSMWLSDSQSVSAAATSTIQVN